MGLGLRVCGMMAGFKCWVWGLCVFFFFWRGGEG